MPKCQNLKMTKIEQIGKKLNIWAMGHVLSTNLKLENSQP